MTSSINVSSSNSSQVSEHTATSPPPILRLPPELFDYLLHHVPPNLLQSTALSLSRVFPDHPISRRHLYTHLVVGNPRQLMPMWRQMKDPSLQGKGKGREGGPEAVRTFCMESWKGDADILNNVLRCLPALRNIRLNLGTNFSPDHLEEMFADPRLGIERIEMRFRPYVAQATYHQFLAGSYFDTAIETLYRRWPAIPSFTHLSIVQDPPPRNTAPPTAIHSLANSTVPTTVNSAVNSLNNSVTDLSLDSDDSTHKSDQSTPPTSEYSDVPVKGYTGHGPFPYVSDKLGYTKPKSFAQPIVFFDIKCLARFGMSPIAANLTHLRLRVPSRDLAVVLIGSGGHGGLFPSLRFLDISTTNVRIDSVFSALLKNYTRLEHLVLDRVNLFGFLARDKGPELCNELGGVCVSAGLHRGKEKERQIAAWDVAERTRQAQAEAEAHRRARQASQNHGSDEGSGDGAADEDEQDDAASREAAAAERERERQIAIARSRRGHRSAAHSTISLRDRPLRARQTGVSTVELSVPLPPQDKLYLVLPPLPTLKTLCIGGEAHGINSKRVVEWEDEFHSGWRDGLARIQGWAAHVADRFERALKKAEEWRMQDIQAGTTANLAAQSKSAGGGKGKTKAPVPVKVKPPTDVRLFRYPLPSELDTINQLPLHPGPGPLKGLIEVEIDPSQPREYLQPYQDAIASAEDYTVDHSRRPPCILCTIPDCEGPARRGAEGERVDGRGGMDGVHREGCGHLLGRKVWGWDAI